MGFAKLLAFFLLLFAVYWSFESLMPNDESEADLDTWGFQIENAKKHIQYISQTQHGVGFPGHESVRNYVVSELKKMGLLVTTQKGYSASDDGSLCEVTNIIAQIKGTKRGKALLLLSHYDSSPHSSYGASDNASGVATILEGIRAFLNKSRKPKNDIILLISDAEEVGLNGAKFFVNEHPWAKNIGLVLNFEARGSGGPSYMLIETNRGNGKLIEEFTAAKPKYAVANSLASSLYKMLSNDTDLTVFREDRDIEGFNFAFIDDHFNYHTALDTYERMDSNSLVHQASYLMPLMAHFSQIDLTHLKSLNDKVYFNMPFFELISYPFEWIWGLFGLALLLFVLLMIYGFKTGILKTKSIAIGFIPALFVLVINGSAGYISWPSLTWWYPWFNDMLHGFTYNGHLYIMEMALFSIAICLLVYQRFIKIKVANLLVAPAFIWLLICGLFALYLKGGSFFIVPVFGLLAVLLVFIHQERPNPLLLLFLCLPAVFMHVPFIQLFPVVLGLKVMMATTLMTSLLFFLALPLFASLKKYTSLGIIALFLFAIYGIKAHLNAGYSEEQPKPSSLLYVYDADDKQACWASYDNILIPWNGQFLNTSREESKNADSLFTVENKIFTHTAKAPKKALNLPEILITKDTVILGNRQLNVRFTPKRNVNRLDVFTSGIPIKKCKVNGVQLSNYYLDHRKSEKLFTHHVSNNDYTEIEIAYPENEPLELTFHETSNDLLTNPLFSVPERPSNSIPMPFVLNDAVMVIKKLTIE